MWEQIHTAFSILVAGLLIAMLITTGISWWLVVSDLLCKKDTITSQDIWLYENDVRSALHNTMLTALLLGMLLLCL